LNLKGNSFQHLELLLAHSLPVLSALDLPHLRSAPKLKPPPISKAGPLTTTTTIIIIINNKVTVIFYK
jgi:hypothetical protein